MLSKLAPFAPKRSPVFLGSASNLYNSRAIVPVCVVCPATPPRIPDSIPTIRLFSWFTDASVSTPSKLGLLGSNSSSNVHDKENNIVIIKVKMTVFLIENLKFFMF